jgi:hypothetical protein
VASLFGWLGLSSDAPTVERALSEAGVRYNVDPAAPAVAAEKWRSGLSASDLEVFDRVAGDALVSAGYDRGATASAPPASHAAGPTTGPRARLWRRRSSRPGSFEREALQRTRASQRVFNRFLSAMGRRRWTELLETLRPMVYVRVVRPEGEWEGRGEVARTRLVEELTQDAGLRGKQVRGDMHPGVSNFVAVLGYVVDGAVSERVIAVAIEDEGIARLTYYRLPLSDA